MTNKNSKIDKNILIVANWKMNPVTLDEAKRLFEVVKKGVAGFSLPRRKLKFAIPEVEVVTCPPFVYLSNFQLSASSLQLGAQNCFYEEKGAFTGEISPLMLKNLGCRYVIIGHSERRQYFGETNEMINKKIKAALKTRLKPILCLGEKEEEREQIKEILENQLIQDLKEVSPGQITNIVIAYEPVWAIGTGNYCSVDDALSAYLMIKKFLTNYYSRNLANRVKILYGGSIDNQNAASYIKEARMDGLLVGGASLNASEFIKIVKSCQ